MKHNKNIGKYGEEFAVQILEDAGYLVIERNFWTKMGEIDIVARKDGVLHLIEVKTRTRLDYGYPSEAITRSKKERMYKVAEYYLMKRKLRNTNVSIDVMEINANLIKNC